MTTGGKRTDDNIGSHGNLENDVPLLLWLPYGASLLDGHPGDLTLLELRGYNYFLNN